MREQILFPVELQCCWPLCRTHRAATCCGPPVKSGGSYVEFEIENPQCYFLYLISLMSVVYCRWPIGSEFILILFFFLDLYQICNWWWTWFAFLSEVVVVFLLTLNYFLATGLTITPYFWSTVIYWILVIFCSSLDTVLLGHNNLFNKFPVNIKHTDMHILSKRKELTGSCISLVPQL